MRWPVSGALHEAVQRQLMAIISVGHEELRAAHARHDALLEKYHELASRSTAPTAPQEPGPFDFPAPDVPPDAVLAAMKKISPVRDKTYDANWAFWEANKETAAKHPDDFAAQILAGS